MTDLPPAPLGQTGELGDRAAWPPALAFWLGSEPVRDMTVFSPSNDMAISFLIPTALHRAGKWPGS